MTILQLKYVLAIASSSSMREAASKLFVSQPALSATIHELEEELGIRIFERNNKGISLTQQGREFLVYAKQAVSQYEIIEDRYIEKDKNRKHFSARHRRIWPIPAGCGKERSEPCATATGATAPPPGGMAAACGSAGAHCRQVALADAFVRGLAVRSLNIK